MQTECDVNLQCTSSQHCMLGSFMQMLGLITVSLEYSIMGGFSYMGPQQDIDVTGNLQQLIIYRQVVKH